MAQWSERILKFFLYFALITIPIGTFYYQEIFRQESTDIRIIDIVAAVPEDGGFSPDVIRVAAGETVRLQFFNPDVMHGIAFGPGLNIDLGYLMPGKTLTYDLMITQPGRYVMYCTVWCSPNHWRMRTTIEVYDPTNPEAIPPVEEDDVITRLWESGIDIDLEHHSEQVPTQAVSVSRGIEYLDNENVELPQMFKGSEINFITPEEGFEFFKSLGFDDMTSWDIVAAVWLKDFSSEQREIASALYLQNCAACHGENGNGLGPGAIIINDEEFTSGEPVASFDDPEHLLGGSNSIYYAKIRRGGMGTGMPGFGGIFTPEESWLLVNYLWTFVFDE